MHQGGAVGVLIQPVEIGTGGRESGHWEHIPKGDIGAIILSLSLLPGCHM